jgi:universal stress protein F
MYTHILVPLAYEAGRDAEAEVAAARHLLSVGGRVTFLHVMDPVPLFAIDYMPEGYRDELVGAIKADLGRQAAGFAQAEVIVLDGDPARAILEIAGGGVDCIVMSAHRSDSRLFGSTAARVARYAPCAVHLLR